jgi:DNA modification methylase
MRTYLHLENFQQEALPPAFQQDDVRYPEGLVRHFLQEFTREGDLVFDPFAGYGTTLVVAERLGRIPYGIELNEAKVHYARSRLARPENLIHADARALAALDLPVFDFAITSPPYMARGDAEDPLTDYADKSRGYAAYLRDLRGIYAGLRERMKPAGKVVIEVANLKQDGQVTTLAWDLAQEISKLLWFEGEVVVCWDRYGYGYDHSYCLVYSVL